MERLLEAAIIKEAKKRLARHSQRLYYARKYQEAFEKRTGQTAFTRTSTLPSSWSFHRHYDPRYCINHARFLARGLWRSLRGGSYEPVAALRSGHQKPDGGMRYIDAFSIPDAAVATIFMRNLRKRNAKIFSDSSFAYQEGKTPLDAVLRLKTLLVGEKIFISQYDFSKFFDSIGHPYIDKLVSSDGPFLTTTMERQIISAMMRHSFQYDGVVDRRTVGTPQGNSISLFISNAAAHPLDQRLSRINGSFVRFADDSVVVNYSYEDALRCAEVYRRFSLDSGVALNRIKSTGIRLFSEQAAELATLPHFDFLSYRFSTRGLLVSDRSIRAIKMRCTRIIYNHLLLYPRRTGRIGRNRVGNRFYDWDLVTCINELRNYIYGGLKQRDLDRYLSGIIGIKNIAGAVSYFSLVDDSSQFRELDGWLINVLDRALRRRVEMVRTMRRRPRHRLPTREELIEGTWYRFSIGMETRAPSFFTAWRAAKKSWSQHGLGGVDAIGAGYSY